MADDNPSRHNVTTTEQFADELLDLYPAANSVPAALLMAAQEGFYHRQVLEQDFETYVRQLVRDELERNGVGTSA